MRWVYFSTLLTLMVMSPPTAAQRPTPPLGFTVIGEDGGIALVFAISDLMARDAVRMRPELILRQDANLNGLLRRIYSLPAWVNPSVLETQLCSINDHICRSNRSRTAWNWAEGASADLSHDQCTEANRKVQRLPRNYICIPDIVIGQDTTFVARSFSASEAPGLDRVVLNNTRGCVEFDRICQVRILERNPDQGEAWLRAERGILFSPGSSSSGNWWAAVRGPVTLPAALLGARITPSDPHADLRTQCASIERAVVAGDIALRRERPQLGRERTRLISTVCQSIVNTASQPSARPEQASLSYVRVNNETRQMLSDEWRQAMGWPIGAAHPATTLVGVWDGPVALQSSLSRTSVGYLADLPRATLGNRVYRFPQDSAVLWIDDHPGHLTPAPTGPCGESTPDGLSIYDHGTLITGMLASGTYGLLPNGRIWSHVFSTARVRSPEHNPRAEFEFISKYHQSFPNYLQTVGSPRVVNLSCGAPPSDDGSQLSQAIAGRPTNASPVGLAPFVVAVAAGNRNLRDEGLVPLGIGDAGGYAHLARSPPTAGFISVVAMGSERDVLTCGHVQELLRQIEKQQPGNLSPTTPNFQEFCRSPMRPGADDDRQQFLALYGEAFDVGAIGFGIGPAGAEPEALNLMWGSSFAAPYVAGLAAQIIGDATRDIRVSARMVAANLVADRIRFTAEYLESGAARFGRIHAERALGFQTDRIELRRSPEDAEVWRDDLNLRSAAACLEQGGHLRLRRDKALTLPLLDAAGSGSGLSIQIATVQRLRRLPDLTGIQAINRTGRGAGLEIFSVDGRDIMLQLHCIKQGQPPSPVVLPMLYVQDFTRCSFVGPECQP
ncbi:S8 family serine peptidase [Roseomonas sp. USHLN139]|uniref:S8 family serine peptidase n=1 Tax=Roseomonas sp. USHLN139 TaxID=3081298 RepID=UPI003B02E78C